MLNVEDPVSSEINIRPTEAPTNSHGPSKLLKIVCVALPGVEEAYTNKRWRVKQPRLRKPEGKRSLQGTASELPLEIQYRSRTPGERLLDIEIVDGKT